MKKLPLLINSCGSVSELSTCQDNLNISRVLSVRATSYYIWFLEVSCGSEKRSEKVTAEALNLTRATSLWCVLSPLQQLSDLWIHILQHLVPWLSARMLLQSQFFIFRRQTEASFYMFYMLSRDITQLYKKIFTFWDWPVYTMFDSEFLKEGVLEMDKLTIFPFAQRC